MRAGAKLGYATVCICLTLSLIIGMIWFYRWRHRTPIRQRDPLIVVVITMMMILFMVGELMAVLFDDYLCIVQILQTDYSILTACVLYLYRSINLVFNFAISRYQLLLSTALTSTNMHHKNNPSNGTVPPNNGSPTQHRNGGLYGAIAAPTPPLIASPSPFPLLGTNNHNNNNNNSPSMAHAKRSLTIAAPSTPKSPMAAAVALAAATPLEAPPTPNMSLSTIPRTSSLLEPDCWVRHRRCRRSWPLRALLFMIWFTLIIILLITRLPLPSTARSFCDEGPSVSSWSTAYVIVFTISFLVVGLSLRQADNDSFYLKTELKIIGIFLVFTIPITIIETSTMTPEWSRENFPIGSITGVFNAWAVLSFSLYWPIYHALRLDKRLAEPQAIRRKYTTGRLQKAAVAAKGQRRGHRKSSGGGTPKGGGSGQNDSTPAYSVSSYPAMTLSSLLSSDAGTASFRRFDSQLFLLFF
jgi:hypothetical protein